MDFRRRFNNGKKAPKSFRNGNGSRRNGPQRLQLESGDPKVKSGSGGIPYAEAEPATGMMPSGIYLVCTFGSYVKEGHYKASPDKVRITKADDAVEAMQQVYLQEVKDADRKSELEEADARMVVFDFYTGERTEALIEGQWKANIKLAQDVKAPV